MEVRSRICAVREEILSNMTETGAGRRIRCLSMFRRLVKNLGLLLALLSSTPSARAQYEIPDEIFRRTLLIRHGDQQATAFKFDQGGRIYLITTRHFGKSLPPGKGSLQVWHNQTWNELRTLRTLFPSSKEVDLAILETEEQNAKPYSVVKSAEVLTTGQQVWFMGWISAIRGPKMPADIPRTLPEIPNDVGIGTISAIDPTQPDLFEIHFRGWYTSRIAGGPIIYWSTTHRDYELLGVIARSAHDGVNVSTDGKAGEEQVRQGILRGYGIDLVSETIGQSSHS